MTLDEFKKEFYKRLQLKSKEYSDKKDYTILPRLTGNLQDNAFTTKFKDTIFSNNQSSQVAQGSKGFAPSNSPPSTSPGGTTSGFGVTTGEPANN